MLIFSGIVEVGVMIMFYENGMVIGMIMVQFDGVWSVFILMLVSGMYVIIVVVIDVVGNSSLNSMVFILMVDIIVL